MSRTVRPALSPVSTDGRADARGSVVVSTDVARAALAALAGLTPHPWLGVIDEGSGWTEADLPPARSLRAALEGVPATPEAIIAAVDAIDESFNADDVGATSWRPCVKVLAGNRYSWTPHSGMEREIVIHFRAEDAVISWRSDVLTWGDVDPSGWGRVQTGTVGHRSRFIGRVVAWASPRSVAVAPMAGHSGPVRSI